MISDRCKIILASKSPRRKLLMEAIGFVFSVKTKNVREVFPKHLKRGQIAVHLAEIKARAFDRELDKKTLVIAADTIVLFDNMVLPKPKNFKTAVATLQLLSGETHDVITGICLRSQKKSVSFYSVTKVHFKKLKNSDIEYYVKNYHPYDKAGAYGIQEWIGTLAVKKIEGSYFNVMGLPVEDLYEEIKKF